MPTEERKRQRFAVGAQVRVKNPGVNGVVTRVDDKLGLLGEYGHTIETEDGERREPGCNLELIPTPVTNSGAGTMRRTVEEEKLLSPEQAIPLLGSRLGVAVENLRYDDPEVDRWERVSLAIVERTFGKHSRHANHFGSCVVSPLDTGETSPFRESGLPKGDIGAKRRFKSTTDPTFYMVHHKPLEELVDLASNRARYVDIRPAVERGCGVVRIKEIDAKAGYGKRRRLAPPWRTSNNEHSG